MARLTEVDVDYISLVSKAANKQKINIYKSDEYEPETTQENNEEMKGFFNVLKSFFGKENEVNKEDSNGVKSFTSRMTEKDVLKNIWNVNDTLVVTIRDIIDKADVKDKKKALSTAIDEHGAYLKSKIENINEINKSDELFNEGDEDLKKEDIAEIVKEAVAPLQSRLDEIEKGDTKADDPVKETELSKEDIAKAVIEAITPLTERIEKIENFKGISKQEEGTDETDITKSTSTFAGINI